MEEIDKLERFLINNNFPVQLTNILKNKKINKNCFIRYHECEDDYINKVVNNDSIKHKVLYLHIDNELIISIHYFIYNEELILVYNNIFKKIYNIPDTWNYKGIFPYKSVNDIDIFTEYIKNLFIYLIVDMYKIYHSRFVPMKFNEQYISRFEDKISNIPKPPEPANINENGFDNYGGKIPSPPEIKAESTEVRYSYEDFNLSIPNKDELNNINKLQHSDWNNLICPLSKKLNLLKNSEKHEYQEPIIKKIDIGLNNTDSIPNKLHIFIGFIVIIFVAVWSYIFFIL